MSSDLMRKYIDILESKQMGTCPMCQGSGRKAAGDDKWASSYSGYDKATHTLPCTNCGGQTMYGKATGQVPLNKEGQPCLHDYEGRNAGRCYTMYSCKHCGDSFGIDSGD